MKNYWHEPTCQRYKCEWCVQEKGHSWGPRYYAEEQLSSDLDPVIHDCRRCVGHLPHYIPHHVPCICLSYKLTYSNRCSMQYHKKSSAQIRQPNVPDFILFHHLLLWKSYIIMEVNDDLLHVTAEKTAGEGALHKCGAAYTPTYPSWPALLLLNPQFLSCSSYY